MLLNNATVEYIKANCYGFSDESATTVVKHIKKIGNVTSWDQMVMKNLPKDGKRMNCLQQHFRLAHEMDIDKKKKNINMASVADLKEISGIDELADDIFTYIQNMNGISDLNMLLNVSGIGPRKLKSISNFYECGEFVDI